jgi:hypothetical protein
MTCLELPVVNHQGVALAVFTAECKLCLLQNVNILKLPPLVCTVYLCVFMCSIMLTVNRNYFPKQHSLIPLFDGLVICFQWD